MKIEVFITPDQVKAKDLKGKNAAVIDVLRASSSIVTAFAHGCREVLPQAGMEEAARLKQRLDRSQLLMAGERGGRKIAGYDLGNSPREYTAERVKGASIILTTTNGTKAMAKTGPCRDSLVVCFLNLSAAGRYLAGQGQDTVILCSGREDQFSLEDTVCAGMLTDQISRSRPEPPDLNDAARAARETYRHYAGSLSRMLEESDHGRYLASIGFAEDLAYCSQVDIYDEILVIRDGRVIPGGAPGNTAAGPPV